jgi:uncharacterized membrane protein (UPF0127 family)
MFVKSMPRDNGMLFVFGSARKLSFWGENTYLPLDIAFIDEKGLIANIETITPLSRKSVVSSVPCRYAIEANLGYFSDNGVRPGDKALIDRKSNKIYFTKKNSSQKIAQMMNDEIGQFPTLSDFYADYDAKQQQLQQPNQDNQNLPVLSPDELGQYLEDSIQDQQDQQQQEGLEPEQPKTPEELEPESVEELQERIPTFTNVSDAANWAQENKEVMKISYQTKLKKKGFGIFGNNTITRYIEPHGRFTSHPEGDVSHEILVTFDETVGGIRAFRMQNIKEFSFVGRKFNPKFIVR